MKRLIAFILVFTMIIGTIASAAPGDIINTGNKKIYKPENEDLVNDILSGNVDMNKFYREIEGGKYINIVEEENLKIEYLQELIRINELDTPKKLEDYIKDNQASIDSELANVGKPIPSFNDIADSGKGSLDEYLGNSVPSQSPGLKTPENYSTPTFGSVDGTSQIIKLLLPKAANGWIYDVGLTEFKDLELNKLVNNAKEYTSGKSVEVEIDDYLLLGAVDGGGKLKAYVSIKITDKMVKTPKVIAEKVDSIQPILATSGNLSGATKISGLDGDNWKLAVLNALPENVYTVSKFDGSKDYKDYIEFVVANDSELDKGLEEFEKYLIVYSEVDGEIEKYNILELDKTNVSGLLSAPKLEKISLDKGNTAGTTKVVELDPIEGTDGWMYVIVDNTDIIPKQGRKHPGSTFFEMGEDIAVGLGEYLMVLATKGEKVIAYGISSVITEDVLQDPPAMTLLSGTHYRDIEKGAKVGQTRIIVNTSPSLDSLLGASDLKWKYAISKDKPNIPKLNSKFSDLANDIKDLDDNTVLVDDPNGAVIKSEEPFNRNLLLLATDGVSIKGYAIIPLTRKDINYPKAKELDEISGIQGHYSKPESGSQPGTTKVSTLKTSGLEGHKDWYYALVDKELEIEYKQAMRDFTVFKGPYVAGRNISVKDEEYIVLISVDPSGKILAYKNIPLTSGDVTAGYADDLKVDSHYKGPVTGHKPNSTRFITFYGPAENKWFYKKVAGSRDKIISGTIVKHDTDGFKSININEDIKDVKVNDWILLVRADEDSKVNGFAYIQLKSANVRGDVLQALKQTNDDHPHGNFELKIGSRPGTSKITNLNFGGIEAPSHSNWKWMYKVIPTASPDKYIPYLDENIRDFASEYTSGKDIDVTKDDSILFFAVDRNSLAKAYIEIELKDLGSLIQGSAGEITGEPAINQGTSIDSVEVSGLPSGNKYKALVTKTHPIAYAKGDSVPEKAKDYTPGSDISVLVGEFLTIYQVDEASKILAVTTFPIENVKTGFAHFGEQSAPKDYVFLEGSIANGGSYFKISLTNASWIDDIKTNKSVRDELFNGFKADNETSQWAKVVRSMIDDVSIIRDSDETITIPLPQSLDYDITKEQNISLTIPARAMKGALNPMDVNKKITIKPTIRATIAGTVVTSNISESDIRAGGATIEIILDDGEWAAFDNTKKAELINSFSIVGEDSGNLTLIKTALKENLKNIVRINSRKAIITLPPVEVKEFGINTETISLEIKIKGRDQEEKLVVNASEDIVASPSFTLYPDILPISGIIEEGKKVILEAPNFVNALKGVDTWIVNLQGNATFRDGFLVAKDISTSSLPSGLSLDIRKVDDKKLEIKLVGKANKTLENGHINLVIKSSAIDQENYVDSEAIELTYSTGIGISLNTITYEIKASEDGTYGIYMVTNNYDEANNYSTASIKELQYSVTSVNGSNIAWKPLSDLGDGPITTDLGPMTIHIREIKQPNNKKDLMISSPAAPTDVSINKYDYTDGLKITLNKFTDLQFNLGGSSKWKDVPETKTISLTEDSVLVVRDKAVVGLGSEGSLPSLPTPKLNGLFLGNVELDVSQGKILGANRNMRYKLSDTATWSNITSDNPTVDFKKGNKVWISEAKNEINARFLDTVSQAIVSEVEEKQIKTILPKEGFEAGISYHIGNREIINKTKIDEEGIEDTINLQYNITKGAVPAGNWYDLKTTATNVNFIPGNVFVRKIVDGSSLPSNPIKIFEIAEAIAPPKIEVNQDDKTLMYEGSDGDYGKLDELFEYRIGNGDYNLGSLFKDDPLRFGNVTVYVKRKATDRLLTSKEVSIKFTENISLANVKLNVAEGTIEGTTRKMEYRTDTNSPWKIADNGKTSINMYEGMSIWIRELGKPSTVELLTGKIEKMDPPKKEGKDPEPKKWLFEYDVSQKLIKNGYGNILEYRINTDPWKTINAFDTIDIEILPTKISIRTKATIDKLASDEVIIKEDLKYPDEAPVVEIDDINNIVELIGGMPRTGDWTTFEFKLKSHTEWMPGKDLKTYDLSGDKLVQIRRKGRFDKLPSEIAEVTFTKNLNLEAVEMRKTSPLKLVGTEVEMEYQIYLNNQPIPTTWIKASAGTTNLDNKINFDDIQLIVVRDSRNKELFKVLIGDKKDLPVDLSKISYEIKDDGIIFTGIKFSESDVTGVDNARLKYKLSSPSEWTEFTVGYKFPLKVTEITIKDTKYSLNTKTITISERAGEPELTVSKVEYVGEKIKLTLDGFNKDTMEYVIKKDDNWTLHPVNESDPETVEISKNDVIGVRKKATAGKEGIGKLPSTPVILNTTSLIDVGINMETPTLTNTSILMEYSLNSTNGKDGIWNKIQNPDKLVISELKLGSNIWIREIKNTGNARKIGPIGQEEEPILPTNKVYFNISNGRISNFTSQDLEYRVPGGSWKPINENLEGKDALYAFNVEFKPGNLEFRKAARGSNIASKPVIFKVIKFPLAGPNVSKGFHLDNYENIINGSLDNLEYSFGANGPWNDMDKLDNKDLVKNIYIRTKAGEHTLPSSNTMLDFKPVLNLKVVNFSKHKKPLQLNGTTGNMEYMVNNTGIWMKCMAKGDVDGNTKLQSTNSTDTNLIYLNKIENITKIEIRDKDQIENIVIIYEK